jgi:hypothetical protein
MKSKGNVLNLGALDWLLLFVISTY